MKGELGRFSIKTIAAAAGCALLLYNSRFAHFEHADNSHFTSVRNHLLKGKIRITFYFKLLQR